MAGVKKRRSAMSRVILAVAIVLLVSGVAMLSWVAWEMWGTTAVANHQQASQVQQLQDQWKSAPQATSTSSAQTPAQGDNVGMLDPDKTPITIAGQVFGIIRVPDLGADWEKPLVLGTDVTSLTKGIGWDPKTTAIGGVGNAVIAGHHTTYGAPFLDMTKKMHKGSVVEIETKDAIYEYALINDPERTTVTNVDTWVMMPDPIEKTFNATHHYLTIITCQSIFEGIGRSIAFAELTSVKSK